MLILSPLETLATGCYGMEWCIHNYKGFYKLSKVLCFSHKSQNFSDIGRSWPFDDGRHLRRVNLEFLSTNHIPPVH